MRKYIAEFIGTFGIVFFGTGSIIVNDITSGAITHLGISMTFGVIVTLMIYSFAEISGAHFNPAVTIGLLTKTRMSTKNILAYIISQILGALFGSYLLHLLFPISLNLGATIPSGSEWQSLLLETILMFFLMLVIFQSTHYALTKSLAGVLIGGTVLLEALVAGPISGASMNPARSIGPAVISGNLTVLWIYLLAPISGALIAGAAHFILVSVPSLHKEEKSEVQDYLAND